MQDTYLHSLESVPLEEIVKEEYRNYQIYTLMDRAIPYLQDGLKPGQRRILFTLWKNQSKGLVKVSSATGLVLTLHPHGPASIEQTIVNLAQDFTYSNNYPLIDKKGYFGERMEPAPAAARYIECRLSKMAEFILFDDMNQVQMVPNYDETVMEPLALLPKLPIMLMNGAEGIGTGFSSVIPSFHHKDLCESMIQYVETGKAKRIRPYVHNYQGKIDQENGKYIFTMKFEQIGDSIYITELPKGYDSTKTYRFLNKYLESDFIKDYIDATVDNDVKIELIFKRGQQPSLEEVQKTMGTSSSLVPNYTLINERGVRIFNQVEEIIEIFTETRLGVVKKRYDLLSKDYGDKIRQNNEIIRFIKQKEYEVATKSKNRKTFVEYLDSKKYTYSDYLADMPIYRMTKEEVEKRQLMVQEDSKKLAEFEKIRKSDALIRKKLIEELNEVKEYLTNWLAGRDKEKAEIRRKLDKAQKRSRAKK